MRGPRARILPWHIGASNHNSKISYFITHLANKSSIAHQPRPKYFAKYRLLSKSKQHMQKKNIILFDVFLFEEKSNVSRQLFLVTPLTWSIKHCSCTSDTRWLSHKSKRRYIGWVGYLSVDLSRGNSYISTLLAIFSVDNSSAASLLSVWRVVQQQNRWQPYLAGYCWMNRVKTDLFTI